MSKPLPPLAWFRAFESAARHLSFTAAAAELGVTQSAISQNVRALENTMDTALFLRKARGLALTDAGRQLLPDISTAMSHISNAMHGFTAPPTQTLITIATSVSFAQWFLAPLLPKFKTDHPDIAIRIITTVWPDDFIASSADIEIRFGSEKQVGYDAKAIEPDHLILVAAPSLLPAKTMLSLEEISALKGMSYIQTVGTSNTWKYWSQTLAHKRPFSIIPSLFVDSYGLAVDCARHGAGIALVSAIIAAPCLADGSLIKFHPSAVEPIDRYYIAVNDPHENPALSAFTHWLAGQIKSYSLT